MVAEEGIFTNRRDAGDALGRRLEASYANKNVLVLGIPRGGVLVAFEIARVLDGELSVVITKKLPHPDNEEFAIGAIAEDGSQYLTSAAKRVSRHILDRTIQVQSSEIQSRIQRFREGKPLPDMRGRIVILADDGIATGATLVPAIKLCKSRQASKVIIASPVSGRQYVPEIDTLADEVCILEKPDDFQAVAQVYEDFHDLTDDEVMAALRGYSRPTGFIH